LQSVLSAKDAQTIRWVAAEGDTPGWDIEYTSEGELWAVEVKATSGAAFPSIDMTANEWDAAQDKGPRYRLAMVTNALSMSPGIEFLDDPACLKSRGELSVEPLSWKVERIARGSHASS
jgi:hypothetical protein